MRHGDPGRPRQAVLAIALAMIAGCGTATPATPSPAPSQPGAPPSASAAATESAPPAHTATPTAGTTPAAPAIPEPPAAAPVPPGSVDEQAIALAEAVAPGGQAALAPLLRAYDAAGLPVIGFADQSLVGDPEDPVGLPYWLVWLSAGAKPDFRLSLSDAMRVLVAMEDPPDLDTGALADALLADIRDMSGGDDPRQRFFARFVAALAAAGGADPLDPAVSADQVLLNSMTTTYLLAGVLRGVVTEIVAADPEAFAGRAPQMASIGGAQLDPPRQRVSYQAGSPCNFTGVPEQIAFWAQFIGSRLAAGVQLPGMQGATRSLISLATRGSAIAGRIGGAAGWAASVLNALGLVIQLTHIDVDILLNPEPLVRTKSAARDGEQATLTAKVFFDLQGSSLDGGQGVGNCLLLLLNALGIQASLPSDGPIPGATVIFEGKLGFNQGLGTGGFVQFPNGVAELRQDTNEAGEVHIQVQGVHQKKDKPDYSQEWMREASVHIHSTTGAVNERNIATMFINGLTATFGGVAGAVGAIADALATVRWDIGERIFRVKDWQENWYINEPFQTGLGSGHIIGHKCEGPDGQWTAEGVYDQAGADGNQVWNIDIAMQSSTSGRGLFTYSDVQVMPAIGGVQVITTGNARGEVTLTIDSTTGDATMNMRETEHKFRSTTTVGGSGGDRNAPLQSYTMRWKLGDPNNECDPPPP